MQLHKLVQEIKETYEQLGLPYKADDIYNALITVYGIKAHQLEQLNLKGYK